MLEATQSIEFSLEAGAQEVEFPPGCWGKLMSLAGGDDVLLQGDEETFGRHASCTHVYPSQHLSSKHCSVARVKDNPTSCMVIDHSTNGTYVNGILIGKGQQKLMSVSDELSLLVPNMAGVPSIKFIFKAPEPKPQGPLADYQMGPVLGAGSYAQVRRGMHKSSGLSVAIKIIDKKKMVGGSSRADAVHDEISTLQRVSHQNIIRIHNHFEDDTHIYLILELVNGGELFDYVVKWPDGLPERSALTIFTQMANAVGYLHGMGISHRDLKPENILLGEQPVSEEGPFVVKLSDFGLSRFVSDGSAMGTMCGTPTYLAPEVLSKKPYDHRVDIWSMGVILYILLSGKPPFDDLRQISFGDYSFERDVVWERVSEEAKDLIRHMLVVDPSKRFRADDVLNHAWVKGTKLAPEALFMAPAPVAKKLKEDHSEPVTVAVGAVAVLPAAPNPTPAAAAAGAPPTKPPCRYGKQCYRKNPAHLMQFSH